MINDYNILNKILLNWGNKTLSDNDKNNIIKSQDIIYALQDVPKEFIDRYFPKTTKDLRILLKDVYNLFGPGTKENPINLNWINIRKIRETKIEFPAQDIIIGLFEDLEFHYIDVSKWNVSKITDMQWMFYNAVNLRSTGDLSDWKTFSVRSMNGMFNGCIELRFIGDISNWDVSNVEDIDYMFGRCYRLDNIGDLSKWKLKKYLRNSDPFWNCPSLNPYNLPFGKLFPIKNPLNEVLLNWDTESNLNKTDIIGATEIRDAIEIPEKFKKFKDLRRPRDGKELYELIVKVIIEFGPGTEEEPVDLNWIDVSKIDYMNFLQYYTDSDAEPIRGVFSNWNLKMQYIDISKWNVQNVISFENMFYNSQGLKSVGDLSNWKVNAINYASMFHNCYGLKDIGDITSWNLSDCYDDSPVVDKMFYNCSSLDWVANLTDWKLEHLKETEMFYNCPARNFMDL